MTLEEAKTALAIGLNVRIKKWPKAQHIFIAKGRMYKFMGGTIRSVDINDYPFDSEWELYNDSQRSTT